MIFGSRCDYRSFSLREGGLVCGSLVSACSPYIPHASEPITLFSQHVWCGAQYFQRHLWKFVAFFGLTCSTIDLTITFGYSPLGIAFHPRGFYLSGYIRGRANLTAFVCRLQAYDLFFSIFSCFPVRVVIAFFAREEGGLPAFMCSRAITLLPERIIIPRSACSASLLGFNVVFYFLAKGRRWSDCLHLRVQHRQQADHSCSEYSA